MNHTKYERRYEIYEYIICMYRQHTNINSESKVKPKEKRIVICILQRFYRIGRKKETIV